MTPQHLAPAVYVAPPAYMASPLMQWARFLEGDGAPGSTPPADGDAPPPADPPADPPAGDGDGGDPPGAEALGDPGKKALDAMKARNQTLAQKNRDLEAELARLKAPKPGETPSEDQIREQIRAEERQKLAVPLWKSEVRGAAAALNFHDPADAARYLNMADFTADPDGAFDADEINDKLSELLGKKPWLAKNPAGQPGTGGGRKVSPPPASAPPKTPSLDEQIAEARKAGDSTLEFGLQMQKHTPPA